MFILALIWGSSFILMKKGLLVFNDLEVAQLRMSIAWLTLVPFVFKKIKTIERTHLIPLFIVGFFGNGIPAFLFAKAQTVLDSSLVGILNALVPIFTFIIGLIFFKIKFKKNQLFGILIGFFGAFWLISFEGILLNNAIYSFYIIVATICYAISLNTIKIYLSKIDAVDITGLALFSIGPICLVSLFFSNFSYKIINIDGAVVAFIYIFILSTVGTSIALILFNQLIKQTSSLFASSLTFLIPLVAIFWGFIDGEEIIFFHLLATSVIFCGIYLINKS